jgi:hypothetical protein
MVCLFMRTKAIDTSRHLYAAESLTPGGGVLPAALHKGKRVGSLQATPHNLVSPLFNVNKTRFHNWCILASHATSPQTQIKPWAELTWYTRFF